MRTERLRRGVQLRKGVPAPSIAEPKHTRYPSESLGDEMGDAEEANLEVERVQLGSKEYRKEQYDSNIMPKGSCSFPLECCPVMRRKLTDDATRFGSNAPRLPKSSPSVVLGLFQAQF